MTSDELREICKLTVKLTELRQNECKHLAIENFAPELFGKLFVNHEIAKSGRIPEQVLAQINADP